MRQATLKSAAIAHLAHLDSNDTKASTIADYRGYLQGHILPFFDDVPLREIRVRTGRSSSPTRGPRPSSIGRARTASARSASPDRPCRTMSTTCTPSSRSRSAARTSTSTRSRRLPSFLSRSPRKRHREFSSPDPRPRLTPRSMPCPMTTCVRRIARSFSRQR